MLIYRRRYSSLVLLSLALLAAPCLGQDQPAEALDFKRDIEPIFSQRCHHCHGPGQAAGGLRLDLREAALKGGASGPAIVPGDSSGSRLIDMVTGTGGMIMPLQGEPLNADLIDRLRAWIDEGAQWPEENANADAGLQAGANGHWSFQEISDSEVPKTGNPDWVRSPIDSFVLETLEKRDFQPSPRASRETLVRRLHLDLLGLPPTPAEVEAFVSDPLPNAYERLVRQLLASPHFGERWARHWLDLARYADSDGFEKDHPRPHAWRYREWVIQAVNRDLPYDRFVIEQMAGDLLPDAGTEQRVATGFHRNTLTNTEGGVDKEQFRVEQIVDRTNTTASVFLGLTMACAQCHDHKYDPLSQQEYYEFFGFLNEAEEKNIPAALEPEMAAYRRAKQEWDLRQEMLVGKMEAERKPLEEELAPKLAAWEARNPYPLLGQWQVLDPVSFTATDSKETELVEQDDGSLLARGDSPAHNNYKVEARSSLAGITAFRIEVLKDPTLPNSGPGRAAQGEFALSEVVIEASTGEAGKEPQKLEIDSAVALQELDGFEVSRAVDGEERTGWSPGGLEGPNHNRQIVVILKEDTGSSSRRHLQFQVGTAPGRPPDHGPVPALGDESPAADAEVTGAHRRGAGAGRGAAGPVRRADGVAVGLRRRSAASDAGMARGSGRASQSDAASPRDAGADHRAERGSTQDPHSRPGRFPAQGPAGDAGNPRCSASLALAWRTAGPARSGPVDRGS